jgi:hypothetical protein
LLVGRAVGATIGEPEGETIMLVEDGNFEWTMVGALIGFNKGV